MLRQVFPGSGVQHTPPPSLHLNFLSEVMDPRVTFSGGSGGTRVNSAGVIVAASCPRIDYDPVTLASKGLLIEEQRTNLLLNSLLNGTNLSTQSVSVTAQAYTMSFYGGGTVTLSGAAVATVTGTGGYPNRQTYTFTPSAGLLTLTVSGTVQFTQLEAGSFATSFTPTAASAVTRTADGAVMSGVNFSSWFNATQGTLYVEADSANFGTGTARYVAAATAGSDSLRIYFAGASTRLAFDSVIGGASQAFMQTGSGLAANTTYKVAGAFASNDFAQASSGAVAATVSSGSVSQLLSQLGIGGAGAGGANALNGHVRRLRFFPARLPNSLGQTMTLP